eukprot:scaffold14944_cov61-Phaeocystis_antarctica.AAC.3
MYGTLPSGAQRTPHTPPSGKGVLPELPHRAVADASNVATRCDSQNGSAGGAAAVIPKHSGRVAGGGTWDSARNRTGQCGGGCVWAAA